MTSGLADRLQTSSASKWKRPQCPFSCLPGLVGYVDLWMCVGGCGQGPPGSGLCSLSFTQHQALSEYRPICEARQLQRGSSASMADKKLILIPLIFICLRVWSTVRFVLTLCGSPAVKSPVLVVLHVCLSPWALLPPLWHGQIPSLQTDTSKVPGWAYGKRGSSVSFPCPQTSVALQLGMGRNLCGCSEQPREAIVELTDPGSFSLQKA